LGGRGSTSYRPGRTPEFTETPTHNILPLILRRQVGRVEWAKGQGLLKMISTRRSKDAAPFKYRAKRDCSCWGIEAKTDTGGIRTRGCTASKKNCHKTSSRRGTAETVHTYLGPEGRRRHLNLLGIKGFPPPTMGLNF